MIGSIHPAAKSLQAIRFRHSFGCLALALALALSASAQQNTGSLSGVVIDPNRGPVAGASVTATHDETGQEVRTETGPFGVYLFPGLEVGMYTVTVTATGFQTATVTGQPVEVATRSVRDVFLQSGQTSQVSASGAVLEKSSADLGTFFSQKLLTDLPIFVRGGIRDPQSLVTYAPTVRNGGTESSINGGPLLSKEILLDGTSNTSPEAGGVSLAFPAPEQFSEFRVLTSAYGAEYGRTGGGVEAWVPRRGGNRIHGSIFDFLRNDKFDAAGWAVNSNGADKSKVRENQYGLDLGGPVSIPDIYDGRGKSFFHVSFNGYKQNTLSRDELVTIPTLAMQGGDFSRVTDSSGQQILIYDPATTIDRGQGTVRDQFPNNKIPVGRFSSVSRNILGFLPEPTNNNLENNYLASNKVDLTRYMWSVKFDQMLSPTKRISGFASIQHLNTLSEGPLPGELSDGNLQYFKPSNYRVNYVSTDGPSTVKHFTFGFTQYERTFDRIQAQRQDWVEQLGLAGIEQGSAS
jgi:Carboxypeptidase regulatory-like domain